jgi:hypothetical protein
VAQGVQPRAESKNPALSRGLLPGGCQDLVNQVARPVPFEHLDDDRFVVRNPQNHHAPPTYVTLVGVCRTESTCTGLSAARPNDI